MNPQPKAYGAKNNCVRAARKALGDDAMENRDFTVHQDGRGWTWTAMPKAAGKAKPAAKPMGKAEALAFGKAAHGAMLEGVAPEEAIAQAKRSARIAKRLSTPVKPDRRTKRARKATGMTETEAATLEADIMANAYHTAPATDAATKTSIFVALIERPEGANSAQLEKATGWKPTSVRGLLGAWRKKGAEISAAKEGEPARVVYRMTKRPTGINIASKGVHHTAPAPAAEEALEEVI